MLLFTPQLWVWNIQVCLLRKIRELYDGLFTVFIVILLIPLLFKRRDCGLLWNRMKKKKDQRLSFLFIFHTIFLGFISCATDLCANPHQALYFSFMYCRKTSSQVYKVCKVVFIKTDTKTQLGCLRFNKNAACVGVIPISTKSVMSIFILLLCSGFTFGTHGPKRGSNPNLHINLGHPLTEN